MTIVFRLSGANWTVPSDWNQTSNSVETLGGGGGGSRLQGAGGGGAYSKVSNLNISGSVAHAVGLGGPAGTVAGAIDGTDGGDTWFNGASLAASSVGAKGGGGGELSSGSGGAASSGISGVYDGGAGGDLLTFAYGGAGGGGAGGPNGPGAHGGATSPTTYRSSSGGGGGNGGGAAGVDATSGNWADACPGGNGGLSGTGAAGGPGAPDNATNGAPGTNGSGGGGGFGSSWDDQRTSGGAGGNGNEWDSTHGSGGGGGGSGGSGSAAQIDNAGGSGGNYGGGGGGGGINGGSSGNGGGAGAQGLIVITYTPTANIGSATGVAAASAHIGRSAPGSATGIGATSGVGASNRAAAAAALGTGAGSANAAPSGHAVGVGAASATAGTAGKGAAAGIGTAAAARGTPAIAHATGVGGGSVAAGSAGAGHGAGTGSALGVTAGTIAHAAGIGAGAAGGRATIAASANAAGISTAVAKPGARPLTRIFQLTGLSWSTPPDWSTDNIIETLGGGGGGCGWVTAGGGGAYSKLANIAVSGAVSLAVGLGGPGGLHATVAHTPNAGTVGGDTWFNGPSLAASSLGSKGGGAGTGSAPGAGGLASGGVLGVYDGGGGGTLNPGWGGGGGGGAAGPYGAGAHGGANSPTAWRSGAAGGGGAGGGAPGIDASAGAWATQVPGTAGGASVTATPGGPGGTDNATPGGAGSDGSGGGGGYGDATSADRTFGGAGGAGSEWSTKGSGGGGGGGGGSNNATAVDNAGGAGGLYGGGGGAGGDNGTGFSNGGGAGAPGIIVISYAPSSVSAASGAGAANAIGRSNAIVPGAAAGVGDAHAASTLARSGSGTADATSRAFALSPVVVAAPPSVWRYEICVVEVDLFSEAAGDVRMLRLCNRGSLYSLTAPSENYEPRLQTPVQTGTTIAVGTYGQPMRETSAANTITFLFDEGVSWIFGDDIHWLGREFRVYEGAGQVVEDLSLVFRGRVSGVTHDTKVVSIATGDVSVDLDQPLVGDFYPTDATNTAIAGKPKPLLMGTVFSAEPVLENPADENELIVYRLNNGPLDDVMALRVGGIDWDRSMAFPPGAGQWYVDLSAGLIYLGGGTDGLDVRCDATGSSLSGVGGFVGAIGALFGLPIDAAALQVLDEVMPLAVGYYTSTDAFNVLNVLDDAAIGCGCWWGVEPSGLLTAGTIAAPGDVADCQTVLDASNIMTLQLTQTLPPAWRIPIEYERHWQPGSSFAGDVDDAEKQRWSAAGLVLTKDDSTVKVAEPRAFAVPQIRSIATTAQDGQKVLDMFWAAWSSRRIVLQVTASVDPRELGAYRTITVDYPPLPRKNFRILQATPSIGGGAAQLQLWG